MKRLALLLFLYSLAIPIARAANPADDLNGKAQAAAKTQQWDDAIQPYERILTENPGESAHWFDAQWNITKILVNKGDLPAAAQSVHLCLDAAPSLQHFDAAVILAASILSAEDKNVDRANQFLAFEQSGTGGGRTNPMDAVGYPSNPAREAAFAAARQQAGEDANASRFRAFTYLYSGKPRDALAQFSDAFRRNNNFNELGNAGEDLVMVGLRAVRGHRVGLDKGMQFVIYGPNGPDGKPNTADDLADPFASFMTAPEPGKSALAPPAPDSFAALSKVHDAAMLYAGDPAVPAEMRRAALEALARSNVALDGWGAPGQAQWYLDRALGLGFPPPDENTTSYLSGLYYAARGRANNYGGVTSMWSELDAACAAHHIVLPRQQENLLDTIREQFGRSMDSLAALKFPKIDFQPLKTPPKF